MYGNIAANYTNSKTVANEYSAGGILGYLDNSKMDNLTSVTSIRQNYYAGAIIQSKQYVGGVVGEIVKEIYDEDGVKRYYSNYVEANLVSEEPYTISLGIGNMPGENIKFIDNYYYKYSIVNGKYPNIDNEPYIQDESYLLEQELKQEDAYRKKLKWGNIYDYKILNQNKYPILRYNNSILEGQEGINIPTDPVIEENSENNKEIGKLSLYEENGNIECGKNESLSQTLNEKLQYTFNYNGKTINTYETYSEITSENGSKSIRNNVRLYAKDGNLYGLPVELDLGNSAIKLVENNFIIDSYNGKEYETVLGLDGKIYELKEPLKYPENFINKDITSIGNNLDKSYSDNGENIDNEESIGKISGNNKHEIEVTYKNGDRLKFNYQTGEIISSTEENSNNTSLFNYVKEKISELGNLNSGELQEITNKYEESKVLQSKLEETPLEEALQRKNNNLNKPDDTNSENNQTNNSLKETRYISIYDAKKDDYQIYQEEELLDTSKQEVVSENEKIEANNLKEYYASEGKSKNKNMGILWITLSIVGVVIILFAIKKRD